MKSGSFRKRKLQEFLMSTICKPRQCALILWHSQGFGLSVAEREFLCKVQAPWLFGRRHGCRRPPTLDDPVTMPNYSFINMQQNQQIVKRNTFFDHWRPVAAFLICTGLRNSQKMNCQPYMSWRGMNSKQACKQHLHQQHNSPNLGRMRTSESSLHLLLTMSRMPSHCSLQSRPCVIYMDTMGIQDYNQREPNTVRLTLSMCRTLACIVNSNNMVRHLQDTKKRKYSWRKRSGV